MVLTDEQIARYHESGYLVLADFWSAAQTQQARQAIHDILSGMNLDESRAVFTTKEQTRSSDAYFLGSGDTIRFFWEESAFDAAGNCIQERTQCINKIGHALHDLDPTFKTLSYDPRISQISRQLGMHKPLAVQSMYIFKQPRIGGKVGAHQDGTFLYTKPQSVIGYWWALENCTLQNGCLWAVPGSHKLGVKRRFKRRSDGQDGCEFAPPGAETWDLSGAVPLEVDAGTLVLLHSALVHYSEDNKSETSRHAYSLHVVDGAQGIVYPADNWLQNPQGFNEIHVSR